MVAVDLSLSRPRWRLWAALLLAAVGGAQASGDALFPDPVTWPAAGESHLRSVTRQWLELRLVQRQTSWNQPPRPLLPESWSEADWEVQVAGQPAPVQTFGWRRWPLRADYHAFALLLMTQIYFGLAEPLPEDAEVVLAPRQKLDPAWAAPWTTRWTPQTVSPTIHFPRLGLAPRAPKFAYWSYDLGTAGELPLRPGTPAILVDAEGREVFRGGWEHQAEDGWTWHQQVWKFDFSAWQGVGEFWIEVPEIGRAGPVRIFPEAAAVAPRLLASAFYHQRSGAEKRAPWTRHGHAASHTAPAWIPFPDDDPRFAPTRKHLAAMAQKNTAPDQVAPPLLSPGVSLFPFQRTGRIDVSGGHYDAGDYSKYTINSAQFLHHLTLALDHFPGVAAQDQLGLPESGDGIPDVLQMIAHEAEFLGKMQDADGGFYFLVYPRDRPYELDVLPEQGDPQVVFPKNTAATAAAVGALAQVAASPHVRQHFPVLAERSLAAARRGFAFLQSARRKFGDEGSYQAIGHYGSFAGARDEWAFAAAALWVATGGEEYATELRRVWPDPQAGTDQRWGWWPLFESYGSAARVLTLGQPPPDSIVPPGMPEYTGSVRARVRTAADIWLALSARSAFGLPMSLAGKRQGRAGWFWAMDPAIDVLTAMLLAPEDRKLQKNGRAAIAAWAAYEAGANPQDRVFFSGAGPVWRREIVNRMSLNDDRKLPVPGVPIGNVVSTPHNLRPYAKDGRAGLRSAFFPALDEFAFYERSATDAYNVREEWTMATGARLLAAHLFFLGEEYPAGMEAPTHPNEVRIAVQPAQPVAGEKVLFQLQLQDGAGQSLDLTGDPLVVWEWIGREPVAATIWQTTAESPGPHRTEVEILWPDGFRRAACKEFEVLAAPARPH